MLVKFILYSSYGHEEYMNVPDDIVIKGKRYVTEYVEEAFERWVWEHLDAFWKVVEEG